MKQITEDYCSFEIAKLLKEKGFDGECQGYYEVPTKLSSQKDVRKQLIVLPKNWNEYNKECVICEYISIPTHQMALKWLRLCYDIIIDVSPNLTLDDVCKGGFMAEIYQYGHRVPDGEFGCNIGDDYTYEQVVEASLLYVLKNLI